MERRRAAIHAQRPAKPTAEGGGRAAHLAPVPPPRAHHSDGRVIVYGYRTRPGYASALEARTPPSPSASVSAHSSRRCYRRWSVAEADSTGRSGTVDAASCCQGEGGEPGVRTFHEGTLSCLIASNSTTAAANFPTRFPPRFRLVSARPSVRLPQTTGSAGGEFMRRALTRAIIDPGITAAPVDGPWARSRNTNTRLHRKKVIDHGIVARPSREQERETDRVARERRTAPDRACPT